MNRNNNFPPPLPPYHSTKPKKRINQKKLITLIICICIIFVGGIARGIYLYFDSDINIEPSLVDVSDLGDQLVLNVNGPFNWHVDNPSVNWIKAVRHNGQLIVKVAPNEHSARQTSLTVSNGLSYGTLHIKQQSGTLVVTPASHTFRAPATVYSFKVEGQDDWHIASCSKSWISASREGSYLHVEIAENYGEERSDEIVVESGLKLFPIKITQYAPLSASTTSVNIGSGKYTKKIKISGPPDWEISSPDYWIDASRDGDNLVLEIDKNDESDSREGSVKISEHFVNIYIDVKQSGKSSSSSYFYPYWGW